MVALDVRILLAGFAVISDLSVFGPSSFIEDLFPAPMQAPDQ
jgi:hypothetical protein